MNTEKIKVQEQATSTVDGLPQGGAISDSDNLMLMQGEAGSRKTVKVSAKAIKDFIPGGSGGHQFIALSNEEIEWIIPDTLDFATVLINVTSPDQFAIRVPKGDFKIGTELELVMYTATPRVHVLADFGVYVNTPTGLTLPRDGKAKLIYVGMREDLQVWVLRQDLEQTFVSGPYIKSIIASDKRACSPGTAAVFGDISDNPKNYTVSYRCTDPSTGEIIFVSPPATGINEYIFDNLECDHDYDFDMSYWSEDSKTEIQTGPKVSFKTQNDIPQLTKIIPRSDLARGTLHIVEVVHAGCPEVTSMKWIVGNPYLTRLLGDCKIDPLTGLWGFESDADLFNFDGDVSFVLGSYGKYNPQKVIQFYPAHYDLITTEVRVDVDPSSKDVSLCWLNRSPQIEDPECFWLVKVGEYNQDGYNTAPDITQKLAWEMPGKVEYKVRSKNQGLISIRLSVTKFTYGQTCIEAKAQADYDSGPETQFSVSDITCDWDKQTFSADYDGVRLYKEKVYIQICFDDSMKEVTTLNRIISETDFHVELNASSSVSRNYFVQAAKFVDFSQVSDWLPVKPKPLAYGPGSLPFKPLEAEGNYPDRWIRVKAEGVIPPGQRMIAAVSVNPEFTSGQSLTGGELRDDGYFYFNAGSLVNKKYFLRVCRWTEGTGIDTPYLPETPFVIDFSQG